MRRKLVIVCLGERNGLIQMEKITIMDVMLYCDGALSSKEMARVGAAIERDVELQVMARDLRDGAAAARATFAAIGDAPVPLHLAKSILRRPVGAGKFAVFASGSWRYAAALLIGVLVGGLATLAGLRSDGLSNDGLNNDGAAQLHLAGAPAGSMDAAESGEFRAALGSALRDGNAGQSLEYRSGALAGAVSVTKRFVIGDGTGCAEFTHRLRIADSQAALRGVACERPDGGWELIQIQTDE